MRKKDTPEELKAIGADETTEPAQAAKKTKPRAPRKTAAKSETPAAPPGERLADVGDTVTIHYTGTLDKGTTFDEVGADRPLVFTIGQNTVFPKLEYSVVGMKVNQRTTVRLTPLEGFGLKNPDNIITLPRSTFPANEEIAVGKKARVAPEGGSARLMTVVEVSDTEVKLDANHPLAGLFLTYDLMLVAIA